MIYNIVLDMNNYQNDLKFTTFNPTIGKMVNHELEEKFYESIP